MELNLHIDEQAINELAYLCSENVAHRFYRDRWIPRDAVDNCEKPWEYGIPEDHLSKEDLVNWMKTLIREDEQ